MGTSIPLPTGSSIPSLQRQQGHGTQQMLQFPVMTTTNGGALNLSVDALSKLSALDTFAVDEYRKMGCHCDLGVLCCHETESDTTDSVPHRPYNVIWKEHWNRIISGEPHICGLWMAWHDVIWYDNWWQDEDAMMIQLWLYIFQQSWRLTFLHYFFSWISVHCMPHADWLVVTVQICIFCVYNFNESEFDWKLKDPKKEKMCFIL